MGADDVDVDVGVTRLDLCREIGGRVRVAGVVVIEITNVRDVIGLATGPSLDATITSGQKVAQR